LKSDDQELFGKELYFMGIQKNNPNLQSFLSLLNKEELKIIKVDFQRKNLLQEIHFSLPMEKKWKSCKIYGKNRTNVACLKYFINSFLS